MTFVKALLAVAAITLLAGHVAPSVDDNNRYLKITALGDRIRVAYTVFFGQIPGASERRKLDTNRDGRIDPHEARSFGERLAAELAASLEVELDGTTVPIRWHLVDVGLGTEAVTGGAFSVDAIASLCLPAPGHHRLRVHDRFRLPRPGETEVKVEDSPGVIVHHARIGAADDPGREYKFVGPGGPLSDEGLVVELTVRPDAPAAGDRLCAGVARGGGPRARHAAIALAVAAALAGGVALILRARRRTRHGSLRK
jgi:hypothetical protein